MLIKLVKHSETKSKDHVDDWMLTSLLYCEDRVYRNKCDASVV